MAIGASFNDPNVDIAVANVLKLKAAALQDLKYAGYTADSARDAIVGNDLSLLKAKKEV